MQIILSFQNSLWIIGEILLPESSLNALNIRACIFTNRITNIQFMVPIHWRYRSDALNPWRYSQRNLRLSVLIQRRIWRWKGILIDHCFTLRESRGRDMNYSLENSFSQWISMPEGLNLVAECMVCSYVYVMWNTYMQLFLKSFK